MTDGITDLTCMADNTGKLPTICLRNTGPNSGHANTHLQEMMPGLSSHMYHIRVPRMNSAKKYSL